MNIIIKGLCLTSGAIGLFGAAFYNSTLTARRFIIDKPWDEYQFKKLCRSEQFTTLIKFSSKSLLYIGISLIPIVGAIWSIRAILESVEYIQEEKNKNQKHLKEMKEEKIKKQKEIYNSISYKLPFELTKTIKNIEYKISYIRKESENWELSRLELVEDRTRYFYQIFELAEFKGVITKNSINNLKLATEDFNSFLNLAIEKSNQHKKDVLLSNQKDVNEYINKFRNTTNDFKEIL